jgi:hypothetical protein
MACANFCAASTACNTQNAALAERWGKTIQVVITY